MTHAPRHAAVALIAAVFAAPGAFVLWRAARLGGSLVDTLGELSGPAPRTLVLMASVSLTCAVVGTLLAWLTTATDLPGRRWWRLLLLTPLALPSFVAATAVLAATGSDGIVRNLLDSIGIDLPRRIRGLTPAWLVLSASTYPFVMMPVAARLRSLPAAAAESARLLGARPLRVFLRITLPQIASAIAGGTLIVGLYMLSEFGAVQLFGYDTLTRVIYASRQVDRATSFVAAAVVLVGALALAAMAGRVAHRDAPDLRTTARTMRPARLGWWTAPALLACAVPALVGTGLPILGLVERAIDGLRDGRVALGDLVEPGTNSVIVGVAAAVIAVAVVLPVASATVRHHSRLGRVASTTIVAGFALPAVVIALALAVLTLNTPLLRAAYQTMPLLVAAYVVHFASQALAPVQQGVRGVSRSVTDSGRLLERSAWRRTLRLELPLMRDGLLSAGGLVLLATMKELPATLLLSPIGFQTLSTEIWSAFEEGFLANAAVASLVLLLLSAALTWLLVVRPQEARRG